MKVVQKDGDRFPELVPRCTSGSSRPGHAQAARIVRAHVRRARHRRGADPRAMAAVALGALVDYRLEETMFGVPPGGVARRGLHRGLGGHVGDICPWRSAAADRKGEVMARIEREEQRDRADRELVHAPQLRPRHRDRRRDGAQPAEPPWLRDVRVVPRAQPQRRREAEGARGDKGRVPDRLRVLHRHRLAHLARGRRHRGAAAQPPRTTATAPPSRRWSGSCSSTPRRCARRR